MAAMITFMFHLIRKIPNAFVYPFMTTPLGNVRDVQVFDDAFGDIDSDALWKVRTSVTDSGWYAEMAIPFSSLRYDKVLATDSVSWGITFARLARRDYEKTVFPAIPQAFTPQRMTYAAQLKGLKLPPPSPNVRIQPYLLFQNNKNINTAGVTSTSHQFKAGGEVKWAVNSQAVLDLTFVFGLTLSKIKKERRIYLSFPVDP